MVGRRRGNGYGVGGLEVLSRKYAIYTTVRNSALPTFQTTLRIHENVAMTAFVIVATLYVIENLTWYHGRITR
jgi:hypothetical protein